jgi:hypothetical protein
VADTDNRGIQRLGPNGEPPAQWGTKGTSPGQFDLAFGAALDNQGNLYVVDSVNNDRIQKLSPQGEPLAQWGTCPRSLGGPLQKSATATPGSRARGSSRGPAEHRCVGRDRRLAPGWRWIRPYQPMATRPALSGNKAPPKPRRKAMWAHSRAPDAAYSMSSQQRSPPRQPCRPATPRSGLAGAWPAGWPPAAWSATPLAVRPRRPRSAPARGPASRTTAPCWPRRSSG